MDKTPEQCIEDIESEMLEMVQSTQTVRNLYEQLNEVERVISDKADELFDKCPKLSKDSKSSYKSNMRKALINRRNGVKLTSSQKSAWRLYLDIKD